MHASFAYVKGAYKVQVFLSWELPHVGQFTLNRDGSRSTYGCIGVGGVIRNSKGDWVSGFSVNLGKCQILEAEV